LCAQLNSVYDEQAPVLSPDGTELYFTVAKHPLNVYGKSDLGDIWVSRLVDNKWSAPSLVQASINNSAYNAVLGFSSDGQKMFLYGHYTFDGEQAGSQGISVSRRTGVGWTVPHNEAVPAFQNKSVATGGHITPDKTVFVFSADTDGTYGKEDIYVSLHVGTKWTEPKNLGAVINTENQELSPWLSADTKTLYFASNSSSPDNLDVFSCERLDSTWTNWSPPKNLGTPINSNGRELFYSTFANKIFYTSTFQSDGLGDIREIKPTKVEVPTPEPKKDLTSKKMPIAEEIVLAVKPDNGLTKIFGKITDSETGGAVAANIVFYGPNVAFVLASEAGNYEAELFPKSTYSVRVESQGYFGYSDKINLTKTKLREFEINIKLRPIAIGMTVNLPNVLFKQSTFELLPESNDELDMVIGFLKYNPTVEIELAGHTEDAGGEEANLKLSQERVDVVKKYIVANGISAKRVKGIGYGDAKPIATNRNEEGRKQNRRVEFKIVKK
jgi:outer membrane protein OmpA-like peptidoglycan-associated protein